MVSGWNALPDATQITGVLGFSLAAVLCARVARSEPRPWWILSVLNGLMALETLTGFRYQIHHLADALLLKAHLYEARRPWQVALIVLALLWVLLASWAACRHSNSAAGKSAMVGGCCGFGIFTIEAISLHQVDALLYAHWGPIKVIAVFWTAASAWVSWSALQALRAHQAARR